MSFPGERRIGPVSRYGVACLQLPEILFQRRECGNAPFPHWFRREITDWTCSASTVVQGVREAPRSLPEEPPKPMEEPAGRVSESLTRNKAADSPKGGLIQVTYLRTLRWSTKSYSAFFFQFLLHRIGRDDIRRHRVRFIGVISSLSEPA